MTIPAVTSFVHSFSLQVQHGGRISCIGSLRDLAQDDSSLPPPGDRSCRESITLSDILLVLHQYNPYLVALAYGVAAIWGLVLYFTRRPFLKTWRIMLIISTVLGILQAILGLIMVLQGKQPPSSGGPSYMHYVYGGITALGLPLTWIAFTTNGKDQRKDILFYSIASLVLVAVVARAWMTGLGMK
jgi:hypothetical protein